MWERNCTSLLRNPIELHLASPWFEGEQPLALIPWLIRIFWVYHNSEGAKPSSEKRKHTACAIIALLVQVWSWYCLLRGDFICNHIQAVNDLGPSEVFAWRNVFWISKILVRKIFLQQRGLSLYIEDLRTRQLWEEWAGVANVWGGL